MASAEFWGLDCGVGLAVGPAVVRVFVFKPWRYMAKVPALSLCTTQSKIHQTMYKVQPPPACVAPRGVLNQQCAGWADGHILTVRAAAGLDSVD